MTQFILNGLAMYGWLAIVAASFAILFRVAGFFHFAHGLAITAGPYCLFFLLARSVPFAPSLILALICSGAVGVAVHGFVYRNVARHGLNPLALLLASLGVYLIGQNFISLFCGDDPVTPSHALLDGSLTVLGGRISGTNCICLLLSFVVAFLSGPVLAVTSLGKSMRAIAANRRLSVELGIQTERVMVLTYFLASAAAGLGGIMIAYDTSARPTMGIDALLPAVVAVVLGGNTGIKGVLCAALLLAMTTHIGVMYLSSLWQQSIVFAVLLVFLLFRAFARGPQIVASNGSS
ncbi:MAG: branched-chain amino acid ABC transporter permease [Candidatus Hydrogenedentales bacterium]|jgi:branched-subunit amino acid ABC-type transport system permease component